MFDVIERLKSEWTDKYVVIASPAPELARFAKTTGQVKTVNMNGRCLVEFDQFNNIGWYDIDPSALKIVPKPLPKPPEEKPAKAAAPAKPAGEKPAAKTAPKPAAAGKPSTADILAAARAKKAPAEAAPVAEPAAEEAAPAAEPAVAPKAKKAAGGGALPTTTADKIAWCRANDAKG
jgi:hypothetical protein